MTLAKAKEVLQNVKAHYQTFNIENFIFEEWYKVLKEYDFEDVINNLVDHLTGDNYKELPQVYQLVRDLKTTEEKEKHNAINNQIKVCCNLCERWMTMAEYEEHYGNCLDKEYLVSQSKKVGKPTPRNELDKLSERQITALLEKYKPKNNLKGVIKI